MGKASRPPAGAHFGALPPYPVPLSKIPGSAPAEQLKISTLPLAISQDFVENIFLKALIITNSSDLSTD